MQKHQGYKKRLAMRRKSKWVKFMERERTLELREETELQNSIEKSVNDKIICLCKVKLRPKRRNLKIR